MKKSMFPLMAILFSALALLSSAYGQSGDGSTPQPAPSVVSQTGGQVGETDTACQRVNGSRKSIEGGTNPAVIQNPSGQTGT